MLVGTWRSCMRVEGDSFSVASLEEPPLSNVKYNFISYGMANVKFVKCQWNHLPIIWIDLLFTHIGAYSFIILCMYGLIDGMYGIQNVEHYQNIWCLISKMKSIYCKSFCGVLQIFSEHSCYHQHLKSKSPTRSHFLISQVSNVNSFLHKGFYMFS